MLAQIHFVIAGELIEAADLVAIGLLVLLEAILSADNAIVLALLAYGLPKDKQKLALKIGIWCAFLFRVLAVLFLVELLHHSLTKRIVFGAGGLYLCWLPIKHLRERLRKTNATGDHGIAAATSLLGLSLFWSTVLRIEFTDIVFSADSILVAMAASTKRVVIITGGILGIIAMRFVAGGFLRIIERFPRIVDGAYIIVGIAGLKMLLELAMTFEAFTSRVPIEEGHLKIVTFSLIILIFVGSLFFSRFKEEKSAEATAKEIDEENPPG